MTVAINKDNQSRALNLKNTLNSGSVFAGFKRFGMRLRKDEQGVAAIEFALIAPLMIVIYFGLVEISLLIEADRNVTQAASLIGDLAAQEDTLTTDMMENYINAAVAILGTNAEQSRERIGVEVTSYEAVADTTAPGERVVNEIGFANYGLPFDGGTITIPADGASPETTASAHYDGSTISSTLLPAGSGIVVARINYNYSSPLRYFVKEKVLRETFFLKPRRSATVVFDNGDPADSSNMSCSMSSGSSPSFTCTAEDSS